MIIWCMTCQTEPMEVDSSEAAPGECGYCFYKKQEDWQPPNKGFISWPL